MKYISKQLQAILRGVRVNKRYNLIGMILMLSYTIIIPGVIGAFCWTYSINYWAIHIWHYPGYRLEWWMGAMLGYIPKVGTKCVFLALITFILSFFI